MAPVSEGKGERRKRRRRRRRRKGGGACGGGCRCRKNGTES
jgi:hypothetical protein